MLTVVGLVETHDSHKMHYSLVDYGCEDEGGKRHRVDIFVDGGLPADLTKTAKEMIGAVIECEALTPYLELAHDVRLVSMPSPPTHPAPPDGGEKEKNRG